MRYDEISTSIIKKKAIDSYAWTTFNISFKLKCSVYFILKYENKHNNSDKNKRVSCFSFKGNTQHKKVMEICVTFFPNDSKFFKNIVQLAGNINLL